MADRPKTPPGGSPQEKAKLADVAKVAGVSLATASRVLNHPETVRPAIQGKVRRAMKLLSYKPDAAGRALASGRSRVIGAVVPTLGTAIFADGIESLQNRLREHGFGLLLANSQYDPEKELTEIRLLLERGVDGMALVGDNFSAELLSLVRQYDVPVVTTYVSRSRHAIPAIGIDNHKGAREMTRYLIGLGHRDFGIITSHSPNNDRTTARYDGILSALATAGLQCPPGQAVQVQHSVANGRLALRRLMQANPAITAIICTTDALALGALSESRARGLAVPRDLSITGYDDVDIASEYEPALTTVHVPANDIGRRAADRLFAMITHEPGQESDVELEARLMIRASCAPPRRPLATA
ncbi:MAG: LacI family DNA-binding transcriptional regulator [Parvibaculaceae bacterium]